MAALTIILLVSAAIYGFMIVSKREANLGDAIPFAAPLIAVIFMEFFIWRRYKYIKEGMLLEDERSRKVM